MPEKIKKFVQTTSIPVRFADMDAFGHVNNSVYLTYFEIARAAWWQTIMPDTPSFQETGPVIITSQCTYLKPIIFPETIDVKMFVGSPGRSSYECFYQIFSHKDPTLLYTEGSTKVVWVDRRAGHSIPLPTCIRQCLP